MSVLAVIPARSGSKGIKNKNLAKCHGRPLIEWTVEAALKAKNVDKVVVSSDSRKILKYGPHGDLRPKELAQDDTSTDAVISELISREPWSEYDIVVVLQPTSPTRNSEHIDEALDILKAEDAGHVMSAVQSHSFLWSRRGTRKYPVRWARRQGLPVYFEENGAIYAFTSALFRITGSIRGPMPLLYVMGEEHRVQVDTKYDLYVAEKTLEYLHASR